MFAFYIQLHGSESPGGGFQAGVIAASSLILYSIIFSTSKLYELISPEFFKKFSCVGIIIYCGMGFLTMFLGGKMLDYSVLGAIPSRSQIIGIDIIELSIGITVFSVIMLLFISFIDRKE